MDGGQRDLRGPAPEHPVPAVGTTYSRGMFSWARLTAYAVVAFVVPGLALLAAPAGESGALAILGVVAATAIFAMVSPHAVRLRALAATASGPPPSAQRRRRGTYLRQSNPDTAGRPRPRAPGATMR